MPSAEIHGFDIDAVVPPVVPSKVVLEDEVV